MSAAKKQKSMESWLWDAACSIRGVRDAPKYKDFILPLVFAKRLADVFDDEINRIAQKVGSRAKAFMLVEHDKSLVRFYLPFVPENTEQPVWSVIRNISDEIGEEVTTKLREIAQFNPLLNGIIDRVDFNATTHGVRDLEDDRLSNLIERISEKRLGLKDVEPDIIGRSYEYLIRKFAEGGGQSAGEFYTPTEVGMLIARIMDPKPGQTIYDPCCGSAGLLIKCQMVLEEKLDAIGTRSAQPLGIYGKEYTPGTWAMANMNMIIHNMEGNIEIGDSFNKPMLRDDGKTLRTFDSVVTNPMWNQDSFTEKHYEEDELGRFPRGAGFPGNKADWGWMQVVLASLKAHGRAAVVLDTGAASRGSGNSGTNKEREVRKWFVKNDLIEGVIYLPDNLFYNTSAPGIILFINKSKPKELKDKLFLINAGKEFTKGTPKNYLPNESVSKISNSYLNLQEEEQFSRIVSIQEVESNDFNISPSRYIYIDEAKDYRSIIDILTELDDLSEVAEESERRLRQLLSEVIE